MFLLTTQQSTSLDLHLRVVRVGDLDRESRLKFMGSDLRKNVCCCRPSIPQSSRKISDRHRKYQPLQPSNPQWPSIVSS